MTMQEFCNERGVSRVTVYRKLKAVGIDPASLRAMDGTLTTEAIQMLAGITDTIRKQDRRNTMKTSLQHDVADDTQIQSCDAECKLRFNELLQENESLKAEIQSLHEQLAEANSKLITLLEQSAERSEQHAQSMQRMAELQVMAHRPSLWKRITGAFHKDTTV